MGQCVAFGPSYRSRKGQERKKFQQGTINDDPKCCLRVLDLFVEFFSEIFGLMGCGGYGVIGVVCVGKLVNLYYRCIYHAQNS